MSWAGIANNQTVTFNNLQDAVNNNIFLQKNIIPASNECITKTDANNYVYLNTNNSGYAAKASNQLVTKQDLQGTVTYIPFSGYYPIVGGNSTTSGTIYNYTGYTINLFLAFYSGTINSGNLGSNTDFMTITPLSSISVTVTGISAGVTYYSSGSYSIGNLATYTLYLDKRDGFGTGTASALYLYYSFNPPFAPTKYLVNP